MKLILLQLMTAVTATGLITFVVTHMHSDFVAWALWLVHWAVAIPIAFVTVRWIAPVYRQWIDQWIKS